MSTTHDPNKLEVTHLAGEKESLVVARTALRPTVRAAISARDYGKYIGDLDLTSLVQALTEQTNVAIEGDISRAEEMLVTQAHTLDAIFNNLCQKAAHNIGAHLSATDVYLKLALRAQSQCRATWETLSTLKNPPVAGYVKQANIAHGPQQVNNGPRTEDEDTHAGEKKKQQNKLLEGNNGKRLDTRTTRKTSRADQIMAPLGTINRPKN